MRTNPYQILSQDAASRLQVKRFVLLVATLSLVVNVLLAFYLLSRTDQTRTIVLAPGATERYVAAEGEVSANLLERFGVTSLSLIANLTPQTSAWAIEQFLEHAAPEAHASLATLLTQGAADLKRNDAAVAFFPTASLVDTEKKRVCVKGERRLLLAGANATKERRVLCLNTTVRMGRLWIVGLSDQGEDF